MEIATAKICECNGNCQCKNGGGGGDHGDNDNNDNEDNDDARHVA